MPRGIVQWFDRATGDAAVVRGRRVFPVAAKDVESRARHAGARVHFDISRSDGVERAVDVTLVAGTRTSPRQHRVGSLVGARRADTKGPAPFASAHPELGRSLATRPLEVVAEWARSVADDDLQTALSMYAADALVHVGGRTLSGGRALRRHLEISGLLGIAAEPEMRGEDGVIVARWVAHGRPSEAVEVRTRVEHGQVAEQWFGHTRRHERVITRVGPTATTELSVLTRGDVSEDAVTRAVDRIGTVIDAVGAPVLFGRIKLARAADPARDRPALAQVALDVNGAMVRAHVAAHTLDEAADLVQQRLRHRLEHRAEHREATRTRSGQSVAGSWRHGDLPTHRPDFFDRPPEDRRLVRHKSFAVDELTEDEAAFDMEQLDFDFYLFRDLGTHEDMVIERRPDGSYRLTPLHPPGSGGVPVAEFDVDEAIERLNVSGEPFVFFADRSTGEGTVVYRRYDGHYGLLTAA